MILDAITDYLKGLHPRPCVLLNGDPMRVTDLIYEIRKMLEDLRINRNLIGNGPSRYGYALAIRLHNVKLTYIVPGDCTVVRLKGRKIN